MSHKLPTMLETTIAQIREMIDVNSVVGQPIILPDGVSIIPIPRSVSALAVQAAILFPRIIPRVIIPLVAVLLPV